MQMELNFSSMMGFRMTTRTRRRRPGAEGRHFRCLKDAIASQLQNMSELLGEKDTGSMAPSRGSRAPPCMRVIEQSLRQQRAFHHMGMMEQEAWRPQRGLPERSVNILRSWLFEHFLHPYVVIITCLSIVNSFLLFSLDMSSA